MNTIIKSLAVVTTALTLAACAGTRIATDYDPSASFASLETFAWLDPERDEVEDPLLDSPLLTRKVERSVADVLFSRGYSRVDSPADADFLVTYHTASRERLRDRGGFSIGLGFGHGWHHGYNAMFLGPHHYFPQIEGYQEGTLMIDVIDARTRELVWRGWIRNTVDPRNYSDEAVDAAVREILDRFPPGYVAPE